MPRQTPWVYAVHGLCLGCLGIGMIAALLATSRMTDLCSTVLPDLMAWPAMPPTSSKNACSDKSSRISYLR